jgi:hypothetical protein
MLRNLAFVITMCATFAAMHSRVLAFGEMPEIGQFCYDWGNDYDCNCTIGGGFNPWGASGSCDFSLDDFASEEELQQTAAAYCGEEFNACETDCSSPEYAAYLADRYCDEINCPASCEPEFYDTWAGADSCNAAAHSSWSCSCNYFFFGEC